MIDTIAGTIISPQIMGLKSISLSHRLRMQNTRSQVGGKNAQLIINKICTDYAISRKALFGPRRDTYHSEARAEAYIKLYNICNLSKPEIAALMQKDRSTVSQTLKKHGYR